MRFGGRRPRADERCVKVRPDVHDRAHVAEKVVQRLTAEQFEQLPEEAQREYRARWRDEVQRQIDREIVCWENRYATVLLCAALFVFITVVWDVPTPLTVSLAIVFGLVTGVVWNALDVGRFGALLTVIPGYLLLRFVGPGQNAFQMLFGPVAMTAFAALLGALREIRGGDVRPTGLARALRRRFHGDDDASLLLARRGAPGALQTRADPCFGSGGTAPEQGRDERRPAAWTQWDLDAGDEEP